MKRKLPIALVCLIGIVIWIRIATALPGHVAMSPAAGGLAAYAMVAFPLVLHTSGTAARRRGSVFGILLIFLAGVFYAALAALLMWR